MRILTVVGTRPQLVKAAALQPSLRRRHEEVLVDTGQHWDDQLAGGFYREFGLAPPDVSLDAGGGTHAEQTAAMLVGLEPVILAARPDAVLVYGDTNSTVAGALTAAKLGVRIAHVEAGLRSFDRAMPEEVNRVVADHLSNWLFAPTANALANLAAEGLASRALLVGDLMRDQVGRILPFIRNASALAQVAQELSSIGARAQLVPGRYFFATVHRQENRTPETIAGWLAILGTAATDERPVVLSLHPGTRTALAKSGLPLPTAVQVVPPLGYRASLALQLHSAGVITDSGGIQRESAWLGVPCLVLRTTTEWIEAVRDSAGTMTLIGTDQTRARAAIAALGSPEQSAVAAIERAREAAVEPDQVAESISASLG